MQDALSKIDLSKNGSYFKFILLLLGDINLNPGLTTPKRNDILWEIVVFLQSGWIISLILYLKLAVMHEHIKKSYRLHSFRYK